MIQITDKHQCCGCAACVQKCPKHCITMKADSEGFLCPSIDVDVCTNCGLCESVCPFAHNVEPKRPIKVLSAINPNENIRINSSSGGIFTLLAERIIANRGIVFGARFDNQWQVILDYTESVEGLSAYRGSKYVQADTKKVYYQAREYLKQGRQVLFSGTPCQIAALRHYLGNTDTTNLLTVDILCHGVPSPLVWKDYLQLNCNKHLNAARKAANGGSTVFSSLNPMSLIKDIRFRDKTDGWRKFRFVLNFAEPSGEGEQSSVLSSYYGEDPYMQSFLANYNLRPSCYQCKVKGGRSGSDMTIADFWGVDELHPEMNDDKGVGIVFVNTAKGLSFCDNLGLPSNSEDFETVVQYNPVWDTSVGKPKFRSYFWKHYRGNIEDTMQRIHHKENPSTLHIWLYKLKLMLLEWWSRKRK